MAIVTCPHCARSFPLPIGGHPDWRNRLGKLLSYFYTEITPVESQRLISAGILLRLWTSRPAGYRRLNQMVLEGWLRSGGHGWYVLTPTGVDMGRVWAMEHGIPVVDGLSNARPVTAPPTPERPATEDQVAPPSDWQIYFLRELLDYPPELVGLNAVIRHARKAGILGGGGTAQIKALMADGWLRWEGTRVVPSDAALKLLGVAPQLSRQPT